MKEEEVVKDSLNKIKDVIEGVYQEGFEEGRKEGYNQALEEEEILI